MEVPRLHRAEHHRVEGGDLQCVHWHSTQLSILPHVVLSCPSPHASFAKEVSRLVSRPAGLSAIANTPNETTAALFGVNPVNSATITRHLPGLRWSEHAMEQKTKMPKLIMYARTAFNGTTFYAWAHLQDDLRAKCTLAAINCTLA